MRYDGPEPYFSEPITTYSSVQDLLSFDNICDRETNTAWDFKKVKNVSDSAQFKQKTKLDLNMKKVTFLTSILGAFGNLKILSMISSIVMRQYANWTIQKSLGLIQSIC